MTTIAADPIATFADAAPPFAAEPAYVSVSNVTKRFGAHPALASVSFSVRRGGALALLGPSGCGKTTMLRCLAGLESPNEGRISIAGRPVFDADSKIDVRPEKRGLGVVFQSYAVWPHMSVAENVAFPLRVRSVGPKERRAEAIRILDLVGLSALADRRATDLSGGQQQRVALARALVHNPHLVLFDEALSNLDAQLREAMRVELKSLQQRLGFTAIYVTHDQSEALGLADSIVLMNGGRVESSGPARETFESVRTCFTARFFGLNVIEAEFRGAQGGSCAAYQCGDTIIVADPPVDLAASGRRVHLAFRRELVRVQPRGAGMTSQAGDIVLPGCVATVSYQGLFEEYLIEIGAGRTARVVQAEPRFICGAEVDLIVRRRDLIVLQD